MADEKNVATLFVTDLDCLEVRLERGQVVFTLIPPKGIELGLPPNYELRLTDELRAIIEKPTEVVLDLREVSAVNSRQLGIMLALHRALRPRTPRLKLLHVHDNIRRLLEISRTRQFFEIVNEGPRPT